MKEEIGDRYNTFLAFGGQSKNIEIIISEIEKIAKKSGCFIYDEIAAEGDKDISLGSGRWFVDRISIKLPLKQKIHKQLSNFFPEYNGKNNSIIGEKHLDFSFKRYNDSNVPIQDYWYLDIFGKETCSKSHFHFALNTGSYDKCRCPEEYKRFCKELGDIINRYSVRKIKN